MVANQICEKSPPPCGECGGVSAYRDFLDLWLQHTSYSDDEMAGALGCSRHHFYKVRKGIKPLTLNHVNSMLRELPIDLLRFRLAVERDGTPEEYFDPTFGAIVRSGEVFINHVLDLARQDEGTAVIDMLTALENPATHHVANRLVSTLSSLAERHQALFEIQSA